MKRGTAYVSKIWRGKVPALHYCKSEAELARSSSYSVVDTIFASEAGGQTIQYSRPNHPSRPTHAHSRNDRTFRRRLFFAKPRSFIVSWEHAIQPESPVARPGIRIWTPHIIALMIQSVEPRAGDRALETLACQVKPNSSACVQHATLKASRRAAPPG